MGEDRERQRRRDAQRRKNFRPQDNSSGSSRGGNRATGNSGGDTQGGSGASSSWIRPAIYIAVALAIGIGAFVGFSGGKDNISEEEARSRVAAHQTLLAGSGLPVTLVGSEDVDEAIASMPETVPQETRDAMRQEIDQGRLQLAWVTLWDTHAEDGDVLRFESSSSIPIEIMALNAKTKFAIPYPMDGDVLVTGVKDGGGGITIALSSGATQIAWPTMAPGDTLRLPVTPGF